MRIHTPPYLYVQSPFDAILLRVYVTPPRKKDENGLIDPLMVHEEDGTNLTLAGGTGERRGR